MKFVGAVVSADALAVGHERLDRERRRIAGRVVVSRLTYVLLRSDASDPIRWVHSSGLHRPWGSTW